MSCGGMRERMSQKNDSPQCWVSDTGVGRESQRKQEEEEGSASEESPEVSQKRGKWGWCLLGSADLIIMCVQLQGFPIHLTVTLQSSARIAGASLAPIPQHCVVHRVAKGFYAGCGGDSISVPQHADPLPMVFWRLNDEPLPVSLARSLGVSWLPSN